VRNRSGIAAVLAAFAVCLALAAPLAAASPELVSSKPFDVKVSSGRVDVSFTLTLSEVSTYPVTITAIAGPVEEVLYEGTLSEGAYRLSAPLTKISGSGELKVVLKTKVTNRSDRGNETFIVYQKWLGAR
jgi:hypothetical protein